jgi:transcriptional regulator with XRE-family HTH domain
MMGANGPNFNLRFEGGRTMTALGRWLQEELRGRGLSLQVASTYSGVSIATISDIIRKGHVPRLETLFRLGDYFGTPREHVLRLAASMPLEPGEAGQEDDFLVAELLEEFRKVPDEWKEVAVHHVRTVARLSTLPAVRFVGEAEDEAEREAARQGA